MGKAKQEVKTIDLRELKPNERNPRKISDEAFNKLCASIKRDPKFMELRPIVIDKNGIIIGGNQRYRACLKLKKTKIPTTWVVAAGSLTADQRKRFILMDNAPDGAAGYWDWDILQEDFYELPKLEELGFKFAEQADVDKIWEGMPEHIQDELEYYKELRVRFMTKKDYDRFAKIIGQSLTEKTKSIWYPKQDFDQIGRDEEWADES